ncbi:MAG: hypothetical protein ABR596_01245 [Halarsenatibacteraceae bacterium]
MYQHFVGLAMNLLDKVFSRERGRKDPEILEIFKTQPYPENRLEYSREKIKELEFNNLGFYHSREIILIYRGG